MENRVAGGTFGITFGAAPATIEPPPGRFTVPKGTFGARLVVTVDAEGNGYAYLESVGQSRFTESPYPDIRYPLRLSAVRHRLGRSRE